MPADSASGSLPTDKELLSWNVEKEWLAAGQAPENMSRE